MRRILALAAGSVVLATTLSAAPCAPSETTLCLNDSRFEVEVSWRDSGGRTGVGQARSITADTGYFWFFSETNIELVIKVLDARSINQKFWVFFGALSNVEYDITVTDTVTGAVKTYHNPLGQFASVGDTGAFEPSVTAPVHETVATEGTQTPPDSLQAIQAFIDAPLSKSAEAFTPCPDTGAFLYLANCRFRLDVHWTDSRGRHGAGRPVQLTNDTGYFWFFSDANVELMVKVLDARGINDKFWVFFGALSNVEYTINVFDAVSGALRSYQNPLNTFASVGDTAAFRGGNGITVETDSSRPETAWISAEAGGSLSTTAADGTVFTLVIPPDSLLVDELVTMAPVRAIGGFPFAGGLVGGVDIQPSGTPLLGGATLSIHTSATVALSEETPVAWNSSGEDFFLFPPSPTAGDLQLDIPHLGGYGVARGTDAERQAQLAQEPVADGDLLSHQISPFLREGRAEAGAAALPLARKGAQRTANWRDDARSILDARYQILRDQMAATNGASPGSVIDLILQTIDWIRQVERNLGPVNTVFPPDRLGEIRSLFKRIVSLALQKIHERCSDDPNAIIDIYPIKDLIRVARLRQFFPELNAEIEKTYKCLTFKLRFESTIVVTGTEEKFTYRVLAEEIPLRPQVLPDNDIRVTGEGPIRFADVTYPAEKPPCTVTTAYSPSTFRAEIYWSTRNKVVLNYDPGTPHDSITFSCPAKPPLPAHDRLFEYLWLDQFRYLHFGDDLGTEGYKYLMSGWRLTGHKDPWAIKIVVQSHANVGEATTFTLTHTPE